MKLLLSHKTNLSRISLISVEIIPLSLHTKGHAGSEKKLNSNFPHHEQLAEKQENKGQSLYFNHRFSFDTRGPTSLATEGNSNIMVELVLLRIM